MSDNPHTTNLALDRAVLNAARNVLRRHGHGIAATCTRACLWGGRIPDSVLEAEWEAEHPGQRYPLADLPTRTED